MVHLIDMETGRTDFELVDVIEGIPRNVTGDDPPSYEELIVSMFLLGATPEIAVRRTRWLLGLDAARTKRRGRPSHTPLAKYLRANDTFRWYGNAVFEHGRLLAEREQDPDAEDWAVPGLDHQHYDDLLISPWQAAVNATAAKWNKSPHTVIRAIKQLRHDHGQALPRFLTGEEYAYIFRPLTGERAALTAELLRPRTDDERKEIAESLAHEERALATRRRAAYDFLFMHKPPV